MPELDDILSVTDVAVWLNVHPQTVREYIKNGDLKAHKLKDKNGGEGRIWRVWKQDLVDFVNSDTVQENA